MMHHGNLWFFRKKKVFYRHVVLLWFWTWNYVQWKPPWSGIRSDFLTSTFFFLLFLPQLSFSVLAEQSKRENFKHSREVKKSHLSFCWHWPAAQMTRSMTASHCTGLWDVCIFCNQTERHLWIHKKITNSFCEENKHNFSDFTVLTTECQLLTQSHIYQS